MFGSGLDAFGCCQNLSALQNIDKPVLVYSFFELLIGVCLYAFPSLVHPSPGLAESINFGFRVVPIVEW